MTTGLHFSTFFLLIHETLTIDIKGKLNFWFPYMYILKPKQTFPVELWHHSLYDVQTYALKKKLKKKSLKEQIHFYILPTIKLAERFDKYLQRTLSFTLLRLRMSSMFQRWGKSAQKISILCNCPECNPPPPIHPPGDGYKVTNTIHTTPLYQKYVHSLICLGDRGNATYDLHLLKKKGGGGNMIKYYICKQGSEEMGNSNV